MKRFFSLTNLDSSQSITLLEKLIPLILLFSVLMLIYIFKSNLQNNHKLDKYIRVFLCSLSAILLSLYYLLEWTTNGIKASNLPLHLCFLSSILSSLLCINCNKKLFNFVFYTGILGGLSSLLFPDISLSFRYFRYYQFMLTHSLIIIIPLYFSIIYGYMPSFKETLNTILQVQLLAISLGVFNEFFNTTYMFISFFSNSAARDSVLFYLGNGFDYFIKLEVLSILAIMVLYLLSASTVKIFNFNLIKRQKKTA